MNTTFSNTQEPVPGTVGSNGDATPKVFIKIGVIIATIAFLGIVGAGTAFFSNTNVAKPDVSEGPSISAVPIVTRTKQTDVSNLTSPHTTIGIRQVLFGSVRNGIVFGMTVFVILAIVATVLTLRFTVFASSQNSIADTPLDNPTLQTLRSRSSPGKLQERLESF
jgi:hypothetical protein